MWKYCNYNGIDRYSRYLEVNLYIDTPLSTGSFAAVCHGRFGQYLKDRLKIQRMPYDLSIADMIVKRMLIPDLFFRLPSDYFTNGILRDLIPASYHSMPNINRSDWSLEFLLHPYDKEEQKRNLVDRFSEEVPQILKEKKHPNGSFFIPYEGVVA